MNLLLHMAPIATIMLMPVIAVAEPTSLQVVREKAALDKSTHLTILRGLGSILACSQSQLHPLFVISNLFRNPNAR